MMQSWFSNLVLNKLKKATCGRLELELPNGESILLGNPQDKQVAEIKIKNLNLFKRLVLYNDIGLGESFSANEWESKDPCAVIEWFIKNFSQSAEDKSLLDSLLTLIGNLPNRIQHLLNKNTITQSKKNIQTHYDISNDFYKLWLDESMTYSAAYFTQPNQSLLQAQEEKYQRLISKLGIKEHHTVLEVGCGWGGFATYLTDKVGCKVDCLTLSEEQKSYFEEAIQKNSLGSQISVYLQDYRHMKGKYDRIVSIEMIEAVGHEYLPEYFSSLNRLLKKDGLIGIQAILCADHRYKSYRSGVDWIRKYIFPGGHLPSSQSILEICSKCTNLQLLNLDTFGPHYATTLRCWADRFIEKNASILKLGYDEAFIRTWLFYLYYCEAAFKQRHIQVAHLILGPSNSSSYSWVLREESFLNQSMPYKNNCADIKNEVTH